MTVPSEPDAGLSLEMLAPLGALIGEKMGLRFSEDKLEDLRRGVVELTSLHGFDNPAAFVRKLLDSSLNDQDIQLLAGRLTTGETYFFREQNTLRAFQEHILREVITARWPHDPSLRIWCAGCSSGEEPYTMAMLLDQSLPEPSSWTIRILGTDINPQALAKARRGVYSKWSFRGVSAALRNRYFLPAGEDRFAVKPKFRANVSFARLNLATDAYPSLLNATSGQDVIICRNVMIYLLPETIRQVVRRFHRCLVDGGWLIVSPSEGSRLLDTEFTPVHLADVTLYRKGTPAMLSGTSPPSLPAWNAAATERAVSSPPENPTGASALLPSLPARDDPWTHSPAGLPTTNGDVPAAAPARPLPDHPADHGVESTWPDCDLDYEQAAQAFQAGRIHQADTLLVALLSRETFPDLPPGLRIRSMRLMARIQADLGRSEAALDWCEKLLAEDKTDRGALYLLALVLQELGRDQEARQALKRMLYLDPDCIAAHAGLAGIALRENDSGQAGRYFDNVLDLLADLPRDAPIPEMDGMTAGRLMETMSAMPKEGR